jgi:uncharacterized protein with PQ loop repeat
VINVVPLIISTICAIIYLFVKPDRDMIMKFFVTIFICQIFNFDLLSTATSGLLGTFASIINNMIGLVNIPHVIRTRDTSRINMPLIYVCILNVSIWLVYALIVVDPFMTASNGLGWIFNVIQGLFYHWAEGNITA